jgi:hypothetical protein
MKAKNRFAVILKAALAYRRREYFVVPIPGGKNHPTIPGWQKLRLTKEQLPKFFAAAANDE